MNKLDKIEIVESTEYNSFGDKVYNFVINDVIWMSNYDDEVIDCQRALKTAKGDIFIGGLGMGLITVMAAKLPQINTITVVEINKAVILEATPFVFSMLDYKEHTNKIKIYEGDATKDFRDRKYDWIYFDMWLEPDEIARSMYKQSKENAQKHLNKDGVIEAWLRERIE